MHTGNKGVILAFGLLLTAASPPKQEVHGTEQSSALVQDQQALQDIAKALREANEPSDLNEPCYNGIDRRNSDLCAQWKAADAAESAANAAWVFGFLGALIGTMTLAAAAAAAWYAKKAADHTAESVIEAKRSADAAEETMATASTSYEMQMRPYIAINTEEDAHSGPFSRDTVLRFFVKNFGQIPASSVRLSVGEAVMVEPIGDYSVEIKQTLGDYGLIAPGDFRHEKITCRNISSSDIAYLAESDSKLLLRIRVDYTWFEGADCHDVTFVLDDVCSNEWSLMHENRRRNGKDL